MALNRGPARTLCILASSLLLLTACDKMQTTTAAASSDEQSADWARAALERNGQLSVVAFDKSANTFTVRVKSTGELRIVRVDEVVGAVPGAAGEEKAPASTQPATSNGETTASWNSQSSAKVGEIARTAQNDQAPAPATTEPAKSAASGTGVITDPRTGNVLASANGAESEDTAKDTAGGKRVLASGPGYSIKAGDATPASSVRLASASSSIPSPARGVAVEHRYEPMICQGQQLLHIDGRNLEFEGDALIAEGGCEIHITNSHIIAHGVGVSSRAANVHIKNSVIEGDGGSVSASEGSQVYTQQSTFKGLSRRLDTASFHDLGGTTWN
jgi:hypothetical protein